LRYQIRRFLCFSERAARDAGLEPQQHQFMLALKGLTKGVRPRIAELAERMQIQHHSAVELTNRLAANGYIRRSRKGQDRREVLLELTAKGERVLRELSLHHRSELRMLGPALVTALKRAMGSNKNPDRAAGNLGGGGQHGRLCRLAAGSGDNRGGAASRGRRHSDDTVIRLAPAT